MYDLLCYHYLSCSDWIREGKKSLLRNRAWFMTIVYSSLLLANSFFRFNSSIDLTLSPELSSETKGKTKWMNYYFCSANIYFQLILAIINQRKWFHLISFFSISTKESLRVSLWIYISVQIKTMRVWRKWKREWKGGRRREFMLDLCSLNAHCRRSIILSVEQ